MIRNRGSRVGAVSPLQARRAADSSRVEGGLVRICLWTRMRSTAFTGARAREANRVSRAEVELGRRDSVAATGHIFDAVLLVIAETHEPRREDGCTKSTCPR